MGSAREVHTPAVNQTHGLVDLVRGVRGTALRLLRYGAVALCLLGIALVLHATLAPVCGMWLDQVMTKRFPARKGDLIRHISWGDEGPSEEFVRVRRGKIVTKDDTYRLSDGWFVEAA